MDPYQRLSNDLRRLSGDTFRASKAFQWNGYLIEIENADTHYMTVEPLVLGFRWTNAIEHVRRALACAILLKIWTRIEPDRVHHPPIERRGSNSSQGASVCGLYASQRYICRLAIYRRGRSRIKFVFIFVQVMWFWTFVFRDQSTRLSRPNEKRVYLFCCFSKLRISTENLTERTGWETKLYRAARRGSLSKSCFCKFCTCTKIKILLLNSKFSVLSSRVRAGRKQVITEW